MVAFLGCDVRNMDEVLAPHQPIEGNSGTWPPRLPLPGLGKGRGDAAHGGSVERLAIETRQETELGLAQSHRLFQHCLEHRREVAGRAVDDLQYFGGRGLLLQCLARLVDQPRIFHCDDRLRREILQQCDLLVGERLHFLAIDHDRAEDGFVLEQRHAQQAACTAEVDDCTPIGLSAPVCRVVLEIGDMDNPLASENPRWCGSRPRAWLAAGHELSKGSWYTL